MKKIQLFIFLFSMTFAHCQMTEGYFLYNIEVKAVDTSIKTHQAVGMLQDSNMELFFSKNKSRMNFKMGKINHLSVIVDKSTNEVLTLNSGVMGKIALLNTYEDQVNNTKEDSTFKIEYLSETKKIFGYTCKKLILTQNNIPATYWYTTEIRVNLDQYQISNPHVPGFPMEFSKIDNGILMIFEIANIEDSININKDLFSVIPPSDYKVVSQ